MKEFVHQLLGIKWGLLGKMKSWSPLTENVISLGNEGTEHVVRMWSSGWDLTRHDWCPPRRGEFGQRQVKQEAESHVEMSWDGSGTSTSQGWQKPARKPPEAGREPGKDSFSPHSEGTSSANTLISDLHPCVFTEFIKTLHFIYPWLLDIGIISFKSLFNYLCYLALLLWGCHLLRRKTNCQMSKNRRWFRWIGFLLGHSFTLKTVTYRHKSWLPARKFSQQNVLEYSRSSEVCSHTMAI